LYKLGTIFMDKFEPLISSVRRIYCAVMGSTYPKVVDKHAKKAGKAERQNAIGVLVFAKPSQCYKHNCLKTTKCKIMQTDSWVFPEKTPGMVGGGVGRLEYIQGHPDAFCSHVGSSGNFGSKVSKLRSKTHKRLKYPEGKPQYQDDAQWMNIFRMNYVFQLEGAYNSLGGPYSKFGSKTDGTGSLGFPANKYGGDKPMEMTEVPPPWLYCRMRMHVNMEMCTTCCCKNGPLAVKIGSQMEKGTMGDEICKPSFVATDGLLRATFLQTQTIAILMNFGDIGFGARCIKGQRAPEGP